MKKTLFISDLDGTLLKSDASLSAFAKEQLNKMIENGLLFTISTARSTGSIGNLLQGLHLRLPVALFGGVLYYDMEKKKFTKVIDFSRSSADAVLAVMEQFAIHNTMYVFDGEDLLACYQSMDTEIQKAFMQARKSGYKKWIQSDDLYELAHAYRPVFFSFSGEYEKLAPVQKRLAEIADITVSFYPDTYEPVWYLEVQPGGVDKALSVRTLKEMVGAERTVCFGYNHNDMAMQKQSDRFLAVANAKDELKALADEIILSNDQDGVVRYIMQLGCFT